MFSLAVLGIICGALLGLRFKVLALLPAVVVGAVLVLGGGLAIGTDGLGIVIELAIVATALQCGFLGGAAARSVTPDVMAHQRSAPTATSHIAR
jgi:hypothetical protein